MFTVVCCRCVVCGKWLNGNSFLSWCSSLQRFMYGCEVNIGICINITEIMLKAAKPTINSFPDAGAFICMQFQQKNFENNILSITFFNYFNSGIVPMLLFRCFQVVMRRQVVCGKELNKLIKRK